MPYLSFFFSSLSPSTIQKTNPLDTIGIGSRNSQVRLEIPTSTID